MYKISEVRREIAPLLGMTDGSLRQLQDPLWREMKDQVADIGLLATTTSTALLILCALSGRDRGTVGKRVLRLWQAPPVDKEGPQPLRGCKTLGDALTLILASADLRARLDHVELAHEFPAVTLSWSATSFVAFSPYPTRTEWRRRVQDAPKLIHTTKLFRATFDKIAALIAADL